MNNQEFDALLDSVRRSEPGRDALEAAGARVRDRLTEGQAEGLCHAFRADFAAYRAGTLGEARHMLLEDHLHTCVACRNEYSGAGKAAVTPIRPRVRPHVIKWAAAAAAMIAVA